MPALSRREAEDARQARRAANRQAAALAYRAASRLSYGPMECLPQDADEMRRVQDGLVSTRVVPVVYKATNNRALLEKCA